MKFRYYFVFTLSIMSGLFCVPNTWGQSPEFDGFLQLHASQRTEKDACTDLLDACDSVFQKALVQFQAEGVYGNKLTYNLKAEAEYSFISEDSHSAFREAFIDYSGENKLIRVGRQVITWGVGDLLFVNDAFPKNWSAFYSGQPMQYLKSGSDAVNLSWFGDKVNIDLVIADFREDELPKPQNFILPPFPNIGSLDSPEEVEISTRTTFFLNSWELGGFLQKTHTRQVSIYTGENSQRVGFFPKLNTYGASLTGPIAGGLLSLEAGYFRKEGLESALTQEQDFYRWLLGYSRQVGSDTNIGVQLYQEATTNADPNSKSRELATIRLSQTFLYHTLTLNIFAFYGLNEGDIFSIPSIRYNFSDALWFEIGANIFDGDVTTPFGVMAENTNIFFNFRYTL